MDDFPGLLARDFGFRPQGKSAPMAASKGTGGGGTLNFGIGSGGGDTSSFSSSSSNLRGKSGWNSNPVGGVSFLDDHEGLFGGGSTTGGSQKTTTTTKDFGGGYDDVFGGPPKSTINPSGLSSSSTSSFDYDSIFKGGSTRKVVSSSSSLPVYDKPVYDDDIFDGIPGLKPMSSSSSSIKYDDVFSSSSSPPKQGDSPLYDDLLGNLGKTEPSILKKNSSGKKDDDESSFDDLIPGFGGRRTPPPPPPPKDRGASETNQSQQSTVSSTKATSSVIDDPFVGLESTTTPVYASSGLFTDPLEQISKPSNSGSTNVNTSYVSGGIFDDMDPLAGLGKSVPSFSSDTNDRVKDKSPQRTGPNKTTPQNFAGKDPSESTSQRRVPVDNYRESHPITFDMSNNPSETNSQLDMSPKSEDNLEAADDIWLTVSEIPLFTQPTSAPPPSRPPPRPTQLSNGARAASSKKVHEFSSQHFTQNFQSLKGGPGSVKSPGVSSIDELEDFAMGKPRNNAVEHGDVLSSDEELEMNSAAAASAAAMKEAMDRAEAKFKHAKEVRERENAKVGRNRVPGQQEKDEKVMQDAQEQELREKQERLDLEREQKEREQRKLEKERERAREIEREREKARQAVERATREARERAAVEARQKSERAAVEKANAEARQRAERAAVQRAQTEARERAAAEARERAERAAQEARERAHSEARERAASVARAEAEVRLRAERAAVERAASEARERAASDARERAANARDSQQKNENDLESFFSMGGRPGSAPNSRNTTSNSAFDAQFQNNAGPEVPQRTSAGSGSSSSMRKASSTTNIVDDLSSIFGAAPSSGEFQEMDGESEERRRARMVRHQRTQERALKALAEKNERDLQTQREQAERHRIAETLDVEIKRWAAGKETNLRALLSTLQYVLWPECGWQPVSLTDLITAASVKKVYRKATLCIHPDKVQQKGASLQQKYIAEKVFDLLKGSNDPSPCVPGVTIS
ncbi:hypothetical protein BVC80_7759g2 [Macleaya cordata]|uniref:DnaJ domain n=1 Tax=Macleaya cordata TaxID=56857 RepID=A0A200QKD4_MACCD|nr:hypothetical protein BVC80_7759g2 [Macleaya cordata]